MDKIRKNDNKKKFPVKESYFKTNQKVEQKNKKYRIVKYIFLLIKAFLKN